ncbi:MAG: carboxypeptidase M32 [Simkaniaceae bacterium]|nr:carboxypeptidase M32 [Simkaniaceae bacterium]
MSHTYQELIALTEEIALLNSIEMLLSWDQETLLPPGGASIRAKQLSTLSHLKHSLATSPVLKQTLSKLIDFKTGEILEPSLSEKEQAAVRELHVDFINQDCLPGEFVKRESQLFSEAVHVWKDKNFDSFAPYLQKIFDSAREKAHLLGFSEHPYDALLNVHEPGMTTKKLRRIFDDLKPFLIELTKQKKATPIDTSCLYGSFDENEQLLLSKEVLTLMGIDFNKARIDLSMHPFCSGIHPTDLRLTSHINKNCFIQNLSATMHEGGHGLYEQHLPEPLYGTPLAQACSCGIHESQSRFYETLIGLSKPFNQLLFPSLQKHFPELAKTSFETYFQAINEVSPSLIRIFADEVTYCLHIILRFELEVALIEGSLAVQDLPRTWNEKMESMLGIIPPTDAEGCLQDIHWSLGLIGYFPTYALGNIYAAELYEALKKVHPDAEAKIQKGELSFLTTYLNEHIYQWGRQYSPEVLMERCTGSPISAEPYKHYLSQKYL